MRLKDCFEKGLLRRVPKNPDIVRNTMEMAESDLVEAQTTYSSGSHVWAVVQAYTSMLNCARAILFFNGIKEKSHFCTVEYLRANYYRDYGDLIDKLDTLRRERHLSLYDSRDHVTSEKVQERIEWCKDFFEKTKEILKKM